MYAGALFIQMVFGWDLYVSLAFILVITAAYTIVGKYIYYYLLYYCLKIPILLHNLYAECVISAIRPMKRTIYQYIITIHLMKFVWCCLCMHYYELNTLLTGHTTNWVTANWLYC